MSDIVVDIPKLGGTLVGMMASHFLWRMNSHLTPRQLYNASQRSRWTGFKQELKLGARDNIRITFQEQEILSMISTSNTLLLQPKMWRCVIQQLREIAPLLPGQPQHLQRVTQAPVAAFAL